MVNAPSREAQSSFRQPGFTGNEVSLTTDVNALGKSKLLPVGEMYN